MVVVSIIVLMSGRSRAKVFSQSADSGAILYLVCADADTPGFFAASESVTCAEPNLVVVTHGWYERQA